MDTTRVTVRKDYNGNVFTLFLDFNTGVYVDCWDNLSGHGLAHRYYALAHSDPASASEAQESLNTLINCYGYENVIVVNDADIDYKGK